MNAIVPKELFRPKIITSRLDDDVYKLRMQQVVFEKYATVIVKYRFKCRSGENLAAYACEIREAINDMEGLGYTEDQLMFLAKDPTFKPAFIDFLRQFKMDPKRYMSVRVVDNELEIECEGPWLYTIPFEIPVLSIVSEVRNRRSYSMVNEEVLREVLYQKVDYLKSELKRRNIKNFQFADAGTRRRFSYNTQRDVVEYMAKTLPDNFAGTSNYHLAREYGVKAFGTMAHEFLQAHQALTNLADFQKVALDVWTEVYRGQNSIALSDCITTDVFLKDFDCARAAVYSGARQDSGDPIAWGEKLINHYQKMNIDPQTKLLTFSNSLNFDRALDIAEHFQDRAPCFYLIGTYLTNDLGNYVGPDDEQYSPLNIVMKMVECNGRPVAKISDDPGKNMCDDQAYMGYLKSEFDVK